MPKSDSGRLPKNWPPNVLYLTAPSYSQALSAAHLSSLRTRPKDTQDIPPNTPSGPCPLVKITPITSPSHPAHGQYGLFACKDLKPGSFILPYLGEIHGPPSCCSDAASPSCVTSSDADPHAASDYDLSLDRELQLAIDAQRKGNEARFINDYRGVADRPNAEFKEVWDPRRRERGMAVWVLGEGRSGKGRGGVKKGDEILVSYGRGFWGARKTDG